MPSHLTEPAGRASGIDRCACIKRRTSLDQHGDIRAENSVQAGIQTPGPSYKILAKGISMSTITAVSDVVTADRYYSVPNDAEPDPISGELAKKLKYYAGGVWKESKTTKYMPCYDPSTGAVIAYAPQCTAEEVEEAIEAAAKAFPAWRDTPVAKRVQVLFKMKQLLDEHLDELTYLCAQENGKKWDEAMGDVLKVIEVVEFACGAPQMMKGESLMNVSTGYDTVQFREPLGVFAGIAPWNFPAMIPQGWMAPICIVTGNCMVLKAASYRAAIGHAHHRTVEGSRAARRRTQPRDHEPQRGRDSAAASRHQGRHVCGLHQCGAAHLCHRRRATASACRRSPKPRTTRWCCSDAVIERAAQGIINSFCGCAGERCMALPVVVVENAIADQLVEAIVTARQDA